MLQNYAMSGDFLVKNKFLIISFTICFSLSGCQSDRFAETLIRRDFKQIDVYDGETSQFVKTTFAIKIDGAWYAADEDGTLTSKGAMKLAERNRGDDGGGGGGGGC